MQELQRNNINLLQFCIFPQEELFHFSTTVQGGVSEGNYATFNLGMFSGDDNVAENRERLAQILTIDEENIIVPHQTHGDGILVIDDSFMAKSDMEKVKMLNGIDALVTNQKNICIGVTTADCVPVIMYEARLKILAVVHAGWKGTVSRIVEKTLDKMIDHYGCDDPQAFLMGIAPCISQEKFEVGDEVAEAFRVAGFDLDKIAYRNQNTGKMHINLQEANRLLLLESGIPPTNIEQANLCTYSNPDKFFSARRQTIHSGRMLTGGVLR